MKYLILSFLLVTSTAWGFSNENFSFEAPANRSEEPKMFGSDVMFLKNSNKAEGVIFVKYITNDQKIADYDSFLKDKIRTSKTLRPDSDVAVEKIQVNKRDFYTSTFKDQKTGEDVFVGMIKKDQLSYVFILYKDRGDKFSEGKGQLISSLASFQFH